MQARHSRHSRHWPWLALALALAALAPAQALEESEAPRVRQEESGLNDVVAVWHEPAVVQPGTQWRGHLQLTPDSNVSNVLYQICRVGNYCFAPPTPATRSNDTWHFDTSDYIQPGSGKPVQYEAGWRVGYQFILEAGNTTTFFPHGVEAGDPSCSDDWMACAETHYFAFNVAGEPDNAQAPGPGPVAALGLLLALAARTAKR